MSVSSIEKIRNIVFIGHGGSGKTSLGEALLFKGGVTNRLGSVDNGNSVLDTDPEEIKRKISVNLAVAYLNWKNYHINFIDTPGYLDFAGEVVSALRGADIAVMVIDASKGVEVGTENYWNMAEKIGMPRVIFVNKMTLLDTEEDSLVKELQESFGSKVTPVQVVSGKGTNFKEVLNLFDDADSADEEKKNAFKESVIELSEELLDRYISGEEIKPEDLKRTLKEGIVRSDLYPVVFGDALSTTGIEEFLNFIIELCPSPGDLPPKKVLKDGKEIELPQIEDGTPVSFVFKTVQESHLGEIYYTRAFSGSIREGQELLNVNVGRNERINQIFSICGKDRKEIEELRAGMIGALVKLKETKTGHTLCLPSHKVEFPPIEFPTKNISIAIIPKTREDEERVSNGLTRLHEEDPTFEFRYEPELKQMVISGLGELHLDVILSKLKEKFGVEVSREKPKIPYRESIRKPAQGLGKYVKQSGGRGQYGIAYIKIEPLPRGEGYQFVNEIFGGAIPSSYIPSVETGVKKAMETGVLANYPVVDVKVTLYDGKYHPVDSSNLAFEIAGSLAFKEAQNQADPYLLEPIYEVEIVVPKEYMGDCLGDLNARRGRILGMESEGKMQKIKAYVPLAEMHKYAATLRSITKGRGTFFMKFSHYDEVPRDLVPKIIQEAKALQEKSK